MDGKREISKKGQLTLFVIIAIAIVAIIGILWLTVLKPKAPALNINDPEAYIRDCVKAQLETSEKELLENNGYYNLTNNYFVYYGKKVPILCEASKFYTPCIVQEPMFMNHLTDELEKRMKKPTEKCFNDLLDNLKKNGYDVQEGNLNQSIEIHKDYIEEIMKKEITTKKGDETRAYNQFNTRIVSALYSIADTERQIINYESTLCEFNNMNWMMYYPEIEVRKFVASDSTKVYTLTWRETNKSMSMAVKTCVMPAGI